MSKSNRKTKKERRRAKRISDKNLLDKLYSMKCIEIVMDHTDNSYTLFYIGKCIKSVTLTFDEIHCKSFERKEILEQEIIRRLRICRQIHNLKID